MSESRPKLSFLNKDAKLFFDDVSAELSGASWAVCVLQKNGSTHLVTTGGPDRYQVIGVLSEMIHDMLADDNGR